MLIDPLCRFSPISVLSIPGWEVLNLTDPTLPSGRRRCGWPRIHPRDPRAGSCAASPSPHCRVGSGPHCTHVSSAAAALHETLQSMVTTQLQIDIYRKTDIETIRELCFALGLWGKKSFTESSFDNRKLYNMFRSKPGCFLQKDLSGMSVFWKFYWRKCTIDLPPL